MIAKSNASIALVSFKVAMTEEPGLRPTRVYVVTTTRQLVLSELVRTIVFTFVRVTLVQVFQSSPARPESFYLLVTGEPHVIVIEHEALVLFGELVGLVLVVEALDGEPVPNLVATHCCLPLRDELE